MIQPRKISVTGGNLLIDWNNGKETSVKLSNLRRYCPCAVCGAEKEEQSSTYIPLFSGDQITVKEIKVIGHYALNIIWKDDHSTGIYEFGYLIKLGQN